jgi:hypothetical protein
MALAMEKAFLYRNMQNMARTDSLTGIGNRHSLRIQGSLVFEHAKANQKSSLSSWQTLTTSRNSMTVLAMMPVMSSCPRLQPSCHHGCVPMICSSGMEGRNSWPS